MEIDFKQAKLLMINRTNERQWSQPKHKQGCSATEEEDIYLFIMPGVTFGLTDVSDFFTTVLKLLI